MSIAQLVSESVSFLVFNLFVRCPERCLHQYDCRRKTKRMWITEHGNQCQETRWSDLSCDDGKAEEGKQPAQERGGHVQRQLDASVLILRIMSEHFFCLDRPTGAAASYFIDIGKILTGVSSKADNEEDKGEQLESICLTLQMNERQLKACEHDIDITKTCRSIIKHLHPDVNDRGRMLISTMDPDELRAIQSELFAVPHCPMTFTCSRLRSIGSSRSIQSFELYHQQCNR